MVQTEGKRAFIIVIVLVIVAMVIVGGVTTYIPAMKPYTFILYFVVIIGGIIGVFLALNVWSGNRIKKAEKY
jgi:hypothetical protein